MSVSKEFAKKVVLITGASSGIGAGTAIHFAKLGASVVITGRNIENLKKTEQQCIQPDTPKPLLIQADVTKKQDVKQIVDDTIKHFGKLDVLINNAGASAGRTIELSTTEELDFVINTNVKPVLQLTQFALPHLKATKGNIVNVSSLLGIRTFRGNVIYCMSKACLNVFTQCAALEFGQYDIRVNSVCPGLVETEIFTKAGLSEKNKQGLFNIMKKTSPLRRNGTPDDVANAITFLANDKSSHINGVSLLVDSGSYLQNAF